MNMAVGINDRKRIHPHKFLLWIAIASIIMLFAGFTSAYIVKKAQSNWLEITVPKEFWYSTFIILLSSLTMSLALKNFRNRQGLKYRFYLNITVILGLMFGVFQWVGFQDIQSKGIQIFGDGSNPAASFLGIIVGVHFLHVLGGIIALLIIFFRAYRTRVKSYNVVPIEVVATYWHFVDILWIYLLVFFYLM